MLTDFIGADRVYIACGYTDLSRGIDGLASLVQQQFNLIHSVPVLRQTPMHTPLREIAYAGPVVQAFRRPWCIDSGFMVRAFR